MTMAQQVLEELWTSVDGQKEALARVELSGSEPALPSSFFVGVMAQASIAAVALAAAQIWEQRSGQAQTVSVDMRRAALEFISERLFTLDDIVRVGLYLTDLSQFAAVNAVMQEYFAAPYPARSTIEVSGLPKGAAFEVDAVMVLD